jgi:hypothetical protein
VVAFTMTDDAAAALISAHVAKETAALTAKVQALTPGGSEFQTFDECLTWVKDRLDTRAQMVAGHKREVEALTTGLKAPKWPTKWAYKQACKALEMAHEDTRALTAKVERMREAGNGMRRLFPQQSSDAGKASPPRAAIEWDAALADEEVKP